MNRRDEELLAAAIDLATAPAGSNNLPTLCLSRPRGWQSRQLESEDRKATRARMSKSLSRLIDGLRIGPH